MATQIATTPIIRGDETLKVIQEARQKPDTKTKKTFAMLEAEFSKNYYKKSLTV